MQKGNSVFSSKSMHRPLLIAAAISMAILLFSLMFANPLVAWFHSRLTVDNPAQITNFVTSVSYKVNDTTKSVNSNGAVVFDVPADKSAVALTTIISYRGESAGYIRVSFCGTYYNKNTKTILPIADGTAIVNVTSANGWINGGDGYWYYPKLVDKMASATSLDAIILETNTAVYSSMSSMQTYEGEFYAIVDVVQPDRMKAFWGRDSLPTA